MIKKLRPKNNAAAQRDPLSGPPLRSVHTESLAELLDTLHVSVAISTYQAGHIVVLRHDGKAVNTHFRACDRPMGMAVDGPRLTVGTAKEILQFWNTPDVCSRVDEREAAAAMAHTACYVPRSIQVTGDIDIHEMAWSGASRPQVAGDARQPNELWFVNTRFSCLCTLNTEHSFVPQWRPHFISSLSPQDRCHLNGLCMIDGRPRYVTALGTSDEHQGWRKTKADGGVLMDVDANEIVVHGLSMPHSPRWYDGQLWLLESGDGSIGRVDLQTGRYEPVCRLDGFTRGVDFVGPYAFIGISQVRESAIFSGIPITERLDQRICGMSVVDLRTGQEVAFLRFEDAVQEVFAVQILPHRFPEILSTADELAGSCYSLPDDSLDHVAWVDVPETPTSPVVPLGVQPSGAAVAVGNSA